MRSTQSAAVPLARCALFAVTVLLIATVSCSVNPSPGPARVEIVSSESGHELRVNGRPYFVRGAVGNQNLDSLLAAGGNSIRRPVVEAADFRRAGRLGLTVTAGLDVDDLLAGSELASQLLRRAT